MISFIALIVTGLYYIIWNWSYNIRNKKLRKNIVVTIFSTIAKPLMIFLLYLFTLKDLIHVIKLPL